MKLKVVCSCVAALMGLAVSAAVASPCQEKSSCQKGTAVTTQAEKACGGCNQPCSGAKKTRTVADKVRMPCGGEGTETGAAKSKGCCGACGKDCGKDCAKACGKACGKGCCGACEKDCGEACGKDCGCPLAKRVNAVLVSMPAMTYRVGDDVTGCRMSAERIAKETGRPVGYLVGDDGFTDKGEAVAKLTTLLEEEAEKLQSIQYVVNGRAHSCGMTAKQVAKKAKAGVIYRVGGVDFETAEDAEKALEAVKTAASGVKLAYQVDGKSYCCSKGATAAVKKTGKKMTYAVGDAETPCEKTAKLNLAKARVRAIVEAAVRAVPSM
jgi:hypothetical protein